MSYTEVIKVKLKSDILEEVDLVVIEDDNEDIFSLEIKCMFGEFTAQDEDVFSALVQLREQLESKELYILCEGSALNVYPSPMQFSCGNTIKAYRMEFGKQSLNENLVYIFDVIDSSKVATVQEQLEFNSQWIKSLR